jgi:hypothetical protein
MKQSQLLHKILIKKAFKFLDKRMPEETFLKKNLKIWVKVQIKSNYKDINKISKKNKKAFRKIIEKKINKSYTKFNNLDLNSNEYYDKIERLKHLYNALV